jgi:MFS family permease
LGGVLLAAGQSGALSRVPVIGSVEPWRQALLLMGGMGLIGPMLLSSVREPVRRQSIRAASLGGAARYFNGLRGLLVPLYLAMALLALGDYGLMSWVPTTLSRRFGWTADQVGAVFGVVSAVASVCGGLFGGWISDRADRLADIRGRLWACAIGALVAAAGAGAISGSQAWQVVAGLGVWLFASVCGAVGGVASLQQIVPGELRGTGVSLLTFCNTLLGLGVGPNLVTLATERLYGRPAAVGLAITTVIVPAGIAACIMFLTVASRAQVTGLSRARQ